MRVWFFGCLFVRLSVCSFACVTVCVCVFVCLFMCLFARPFLYMFVCLRVCLCVCVCFIGLFGWLAASFFICLVRLLVWFNLEVLLAHLYVVLISWFPCVCFHKIDELLRCLLVCLNMCQFVPLFNRLCVRAIVCVLAFSYLCMFYRVSMTECLFVLFV